VPSNNHKDRKKEDTMARRAEEIKSVRHTEAKNEKNEPKVPAAYEEEYYEMGDVVPEEAGLNTASGVLALALLALALYLIYAALT
jgi:hypothetical protein